MKLSCMICNESHKADTKRFPITKYGQIEKLVNGVVTKEECIEGYICRKCIKREKKRKQNA